MPQQKALPDPGAAVHRDFRVVPQRFLQDRRLSKENCLVLSAIWSNAIREDGSYHGTKISNSELARQSFIQGGKQSVQLHLKRLRVLGAIRVEKGSSKTRIIHFTYPVPEEYHKLVIPDWILTFHKVLSSSQLILLAMINTLQRASHDTIRGRMGMGLQTYRDCFQQLINKLSQHPTRFSSQPNSIFYRPNSILNIIQPNSISDEPNSISDEPNSISDPYRYKGGIGCRVLSKDNTITVLRTAQSVDPSIEKSGLSNPPIKGIHMTISSKRIPYRDERPAEQVARSKKLMNCGPRTHPPAPIKEKTYSVQYVADLEYAMDLPFIVHHKDRNSRAYAEAIRVIKALDKGPANVLRQDEMSAIMTAMAGKKIAGMPNPLTREWLQRAFFNRKFSQEERRVLFQRLSNMESVEYGGKAKRISLADAMRSFTGWSYLCQVSIRPPSRAIARPPVNQEEVAWEMEQALEIMPKQPRDQKIQLAHFLLSLKNRWRTEYKHKLKDPWRSFFSRMLSYFESKGGTIYPGWFNPDRKPVTWWLDEEGYFDKRPARTQAPIHFTEAPL